MNIIILFGILFAIILISEIVLSSTWNKYYFLYGIPIYSRTIDISNIEQSSQKISNFINSIDTVPGFSKYKAELLENNIYAFRKKMISESFYHNGLENIHGIITIDSEQRTLKIKGNIRYSFIVLMLYFFVFYIYDFVSFTSIFSVLLSIFILSALSYAFDYRKYKKLFDEITKKLNC